MDSHYDTITPNRSVTTPLSKGDGVELQVCFDCKERKKEIHAKIQTNRTPRDKVSESLCPTPVEYKSTIFFPLSPKSDGVGSSPSTRKVCVTYSVLIIIPRRMVIPPTFYILSSSL